MISLNAAQKLMVMLGVDSLVVKMGGHKRGRFASNTKKGPGRIHLDGKKKEEGESK